MKRVVAHLVCATIFLWPTTNMALANKVFLAGSEAQFGFGQNINDGGFIPNAWNELTFTASAENAYRLELRIREGSFRRGYQEHKINLEIPAGNGLRQKRMRVPIFSARLAELSLFGPEGTLSTKIFPLALGQEISASDFASTQTFIEPSAWLGLAEFNAEDTVDWSNTKLLAALAAGVHLRANKNVLTELNGSIGLGKIIRNNQGSNSHANDTFVFIEKLLLALEPTMYSPSAKNYALGWWAAGLLLLVAFWFVFWSQKSTWVYATTFSLLAASVGAYYLSPQKNQYQKNVVLIVGSGGWGLKIQSSKILHLSSTPLRLPAEAKIIGQYPKNCDQDFCTLPTQAWETVFYWMPPKAATLPVRIRNGIIENTSNQPLHHLYVIGYGQQEPLPANAKRKLQGDDTGADPRTIALASFLAKGTVIVGWNETNTSMQIALPEGT